MKSYSKLAKIGALLTLGIFLAGCFHKTQEPPPLKKKQPVSQQKKGKLPTSQEAKISPSPAAAKDTTAQVKTDADIEAVLNNLDNFDDTEEVFDDSDIDNF